MKRVISTDDAPAAVGAYSQAATNGDIIITSGQLPLTTEGELLDDEPVGEQTRQCLDNVAAVLGSEGLSLDDVIKTTVFLDDIDDFEAFDEAYSEAFQSEPPPGAPSASMRFRKGPLSKSRPSRRPSDGRDASGCRPAACGAVRPARSVLAKLYPSEFRHSLSE